MGEGEYVLYAMCYSCIYVCVCSSMPARVCLHVCVHTCVKIVEGVITPHCVVYRDYSYSTVID